MVVAVVAHGAAALSNKNFGSFSGIKFTDYDLFDFARCVHYSMNNTAHGPVTMLFGRDEVCHNAAALADLEAVVDAVWLCRC